MRFPLTPSQTVGPYLHIGLDWLNTTELAGAGVAGERILIEGRLLDAEGQVVPDGLIEIWQADAHGNYAHADPGREPRADAGFLGFGRCPTDAEGRFRFSTIKPGSVPAADGRPQAPHILVNIFARGLLKQLTTRIYFPQDDHDSDIVLAAVPVERRATLVARLVAERPGTLAWNIVLGGGGTDETVFFDL
jgi:protocatechuate 3,4-dioxygenase alpha subunit